MSLRVDTVSLISGALVCGHRGLGVRGSQVPASGDAGPGYLYNDLSLPADANKEVRGLIVTPPAAGTLATNEDSSFTFMAPDGSYSFVYRLFVDGADLGTATVTLTVGGSSVSLFISDALHSHSAEAPALSTALLLSLADALHNHSAEAPALSTALLLSLADALHNHSGDSINLDTSNSTWLVLQEASHEHSADLVSLTLNDLITIQEALHNHRAGSPQLEPGQKTLSIAEAIHLHLADNLLISIPTGALTSDSRFVITVGPRSFVITPGARFMKAMATHRTFNISSRTK